MGVIRPYVPVRLVMGVLTTHGELHDQVVEILGESYCPVLTESTHTPFSFTDYYDEEMGGNPERYFLVFRDLVDPSRLSDIKIHTNQVEERFATGRGRVVNLDPGLLSAGSLILATTKNRSHRIPLEKGIYAETTLIYYGHQFNALPWTYADYGSDRFRELFKMYRTMYMRQLKEEQKS